eukprot:m.215617 g.215617  ORF g.215617 m.215617 type:complete len:227 (-) comp33190_c3_seq16:1823-2503(-)
MPLSDFGEQLKSGFGSSKAWVKAVVIATILGFVVLACFGCVRVSAYFERDSARYLSPKYVQDDQVDNVVTHVACGFATFLMSPVVLVVFILTDNAAARISVAVLYGCGILATAGTVASINSTLSAIAGMAVVITAVVWTIWWIATTIVMYTRMCQHRTTQTNEWMLRSIGMAAFGFLLLPILHAFVGSNNSNGKTYFAADAVVLIVFLLFIVGFSEFLIRKFLQNK